MAIEPVALDPQVNNCRVALVIKANARYSNNSKRPRMFRIKPIPAVRLLARLVLEEFPRFLLGKQFYGQLRPKLSPHRLSSLILFTEIANCIGRNVGVITNIIRRLFRLLGLGYQVPAEALVRVRPDPWKVAHSCSYTFPTSPMEYM